VLTAGALALLLSNCSSIERLRNIGEQPRLDAIQNPATRAGYKPVQMPMPAPQPAVYNPNSLWRNGSRAFFKDQRAHQVGDILTVLVKSPTAPGSRQDPAQPRQPQLRHDDFIGASTQSSAAKYLPGHRP
jgi:flagellar L-ring protein precursor FlgH